MAKKKGLSPKRKAFCEEYIVDLNATQAAIRAGYSAKTADRIASVMLGIVEVREYIDQLKSERSTRTEISADNVLKEIARLAFSDIRQSFTEHGDLKNPIDLDDEIASSIQSIDIVSTSDSDGAPLYTKKVKLADKTKNLELLCRHLGLLNDKLKLGVMENNPLTDLLGALDGNTTGLPDGNS